MDPDAIAIFPLSNVVLFPRVLTPLHLFEPRYRQLADRVLAGERRIGMVTVLPEHVAAMAGDPPVFPVGCLGVVTQSQRLPDGRFNLVLAGERRFRVVSEDPPEGQRLYRVARIDWLEDPYPEATQPRVAELRARIVQQVARLVRHSDPGGADGLTEVQFADVEDAVFVNSLCNSLPFPPEERQSLLEAESVVARFERLEALLSFRIAELLAGGATRIRPAALTSARNFDPRRKNSKFVER